MIYLLFVIVAQSLVFCVVVFVAFFIMRHLAIVFLSDFQFSEGPSWPWSHDIWIYNYICNQCLLPLMLWVRISIRARCTTLCDKACHWLATGRWISPGPPVSSTNKTDCHDITEILLKVVLNTIKQTTTININIRFVL